MRAKVNRQACGGSGLCAEICPAVFAQDPNYIAHVVEGGERVDRATVPTCEEDAVREAAEACPTEAILAEETDPHLMSQREGEHG